MSVSIYDKKSDALKSVAGLTRQIIPITQSEYDALTDEQKNLDVIYNITDDDSEVVQVTDEVVEGSEDAVTSGAVYEQINQLNGALTKYPKVTKDSKTLTNGTAYYYNVDSGAGQYLITVNLKNNVFYAIGLFITDGSDYAGYTSIKDSYIEIIASSATSVRVTNKSGYDLLGEVSILKLL